MDPKENIENLMNEKEIQFRDFRLSKFEKRQNEDGAEELILEGVPAVFETDTVIYKGRYYEDREKIASEAFTGCDMTDVIFNYNHCGRVYARTRNKSLEVWVENDGLHMRATLNANDTGHQELYRDIQSGLIDRMSFAFHVAESKWEYTEVGDDYTIYTRTVSKIDKLYDVSAVDIPAYDTTSISARGAFDSVREERKAESEKLQAELELRKNKLLLLRKAGIK